MTRSIEELATGEMLVAKIHSLHLSLADKVRETIGERDEDIAIAAALAALDAATVYVEGDKEAGIAWLRDALDLIEDGQPIVAETIQ